MKYIPEKNPNIVEFSTKPTIDKKDWTEAYEYNKIKTIVQDKADNYTFIYAGEDDSRPKLSTEIGRTFLSKQKHGDWDSFDHLIQIRNSMHVIKVNIKNWMNIQCSCNTFLKHNKYKNIIAVSTRLNLTSFDNIAMSLPLTKKAKKGR